MAEALSIGGLMIDILGAIILAIPDTPILNTLTTSGRLEEALQQIEHRGILSGTPKFNELIKAVEDFERINLADEISEDLYGIYLEDRDGSEGTYRHLILEGESGKQYKLNSSFGSLRMAIESRIRIQGAKFRLVGFGFLILGFILQIVGLVVSP